MTPAFQGWSLTSCFSSNDWFIDHSFTVAFLNLHTVGILGWKTPCYGGSLVYFRMFSTHWMPVSTSSLLGQSSKTVFRNFHMSSRRQNFLNGELFYTFLIRDLLNICWTEEWARNNLPNVNWFLKSIEGEYLLQWLQASKIVCNTYNDLPKKYIYSKETKSNTLVSYRSN